MRIGTAYFVSRSAAIRYYANYHFTKEDVDRKLAEGEIHIGLPPHRAFEKINTIDDGTRYEIEVSDKDQRMFIEATMQANDRAKRENAPMFVYYSAANQGTWFVRNAAEGVPEGGSLIATINP